MYNIQQVAPMRREWNIRFTHTFPASINLVTMTILLDSLCQTMAHMSATVDFVGPKTNTKVYQYMKMMLNYWCGLSLTESHIITSNYKHPLITKLVILSTPNFIGGFLGSVRLCGYVYMCARVCIYICNAFVFYSHPEQRYNLECHLCISEKMHTYNNFTTLVITSPLIMLYFRKKKTW